MTVDRPELVIGFVGALGTDFDGPFGAVEAAFEELGYGCIPVRLSTILKEYPEPAPFDKTALQEAPFDRYLDTYMTAGNDLRRAMVRGDALALAAIARVREERRLRNTEGDDDARSTQPLWGKAFLLRSLKHPQEVRLLREVYGPSFFLISVYAPEHHRLEYVSRKIAESRDHFQAEDHKPEAMRLLKRDEEETDDPMGQKVRETFWRGDAYVDTTRDAEMRLSIKRVIHLWFGEPFTTPSRDEYLMFCARAAAYRSASMGRQVGAVIVTKDGSILATGTNEVPKAGSEPEWGGVY